MPTIVERFRAAFRNPQPAPAAIEGAPDGAMVIRERQAPDGIIARTLSTMRTLMGQPQYGRYAGFYEPNREITPQDLYGISQRDLGILYRMRVAHPVIASGMDFARSAVEAVEYGLEPADPSLRARAARDAVERAFVQTPGLSLSGFVGMVFDLSRTNGFAALEIVDAGDGRHIAPRPIAPHLMQGWIYDSDFVGLAGVRVVSNASTVTLDVDRFAWYGRQHYPGQYYGLSDLRPLLSLFAAYEQDLRTYIDQQRNARGFLYGQENAGGTNKLSVDRMIEYLARYHAGDDFPLIVPAGMEIGFMSVTNPAVAHFKEMLGYYDTSFREALMSSLGSLGINGEGARSLGESFRVVDAQRLRARLDQFLRMINGETSAYSSFLRMVTINEGYEADLTPRIVCAGQVGVDMTQQRSDLIALSNAGIVTRADIGEDNVRHLIAGLGLEVPDQVYTPQSSPANASPGNPAGQPATMPAIDPAAMIQTRARRVPSSVQARILDGLMRHEATIGVDVDERIVSAARRWAMGAIPTDEDVAMIVTLLSAPAGMAALAARAGQPEWLLAQLVGGRAGAEYWRGEYIRRGIGNAN
jgi:hypothetical protein